MSTDEEYAAAVKLIVAKCVTLHALQSRAKQSYGGTENLPVFVRKLLADLAEEIGDLIAKNPPRPEHASVAETARKLIDVAREVRLELDSVPKRH